MTGLAPTLAEAAERLGLHPLEVARLLGHGGTLRSDLRIEETEIETLARTAGVEHWWTGAELLPLQDPERTKALTRLLARKLLRRDRVGPQTTRADNLLRGLKTADANRLRPVINALIRNRVLLTGSSSRGVQISVEPGREWVVRALGGGQPLSTVVQQSRGRR